VFSVNIILELKSHENFINENECYYIGALQIEIKAIEWGMFSPLTRKGFKIIFNGLVSRKKMHTN
jgi:hypothetical protein